MPIIEIIQRPIEPRDIYKNLQEYLKQGGELESLWYEYATIQEKIKGVHAIDYTRQKGTHNPNHTKTQALAHMIDRKDEIKKNANMIFNRLEEQESQLDILSDEVLEVESYRTNKQDFKQMQQYINIYRKFKKYHREVMDAIGKNA